MFTKISKSIVAALIAVTVLSGCGSVQYETVKMVPKLSDGWGSYGTLSWNYDGDTGLLEITGTGAIEKNEGENDYQWEDFREGVTDLKIGDGITSIGDGAFKKLVNLTELTIPSSVCRLGAESFYGCGLTSLVVPETVTEIDSFAFGHCVDLENAEIYSPYVGFGMFDYCTSLKSVLISDNVTQISEDGFDSAGIEEISIPSSVEEIDKGGFFSCDSLKTLKIPYTVKTVGDGVAAESDSLKAVEVEGDLTSWMLSNLDYLETVKLGEYCTKIEIGAFSGSELSAIYIPDSVTDIAEEVFPDCDIDVYCHKNTAAWTMCGKNGNLNFMDLDDPDNAAKFEKLWNSYFE